MNDASKMEEAEPNAYHGIQRNTFKFFPSFKAWLFFSTLNILVAFTIFILYISSFLLPKGIYNASYDG